MTTRGIQYLQQQNIPHEVVTYDHRQKGAEFAAQAVGFPLARTVKTLVVQLGAGRYALALMPGDQQMSMKKVARALGAKRAAMAEGKDAQRLTGYLVGGISPFGTRRRLPVVMASDLMAWDWVMINAGQRGIMVKLSPTDMADTLNAVQSHLSDTV